MSEELRPCPFCGGKAVTSTFFDWDDLEYMAFEVNDSESIDGEVTCENERCINGWYLSPKDWNTRPIEDALHARISELSQAVGLITTLKPTMVMDTEHPLDMAKEVAEYVTARIAELEALVERLIEAGNKLGTYFIGYTPRKKELLQREFWEAWRSAVSDWQSMTSHVTNPSDSQGIVTRNGGEG